MRKYVTRFAFWAPRILAILFILFIAMFSLDVFDGNYGFWETIVAIFMHNIPTLILILVLAIAWKNEIVGAVAFILAGLLYIVLIAAKIFYGSPFQWYYLSWSVIVAGPAFLIGILFLVGSQKKETKLAK